MKKKKLLLIISGVVILIAVGLLVFFFFGYDKGYNVESVPGGVSITGYRGKAVSVLEIPSTIKGKKVVGIIALNSCI